MKESHIAYIAHRIIQISKMLEIDPIDLTQAFPLEILADDEILEITEYIIEAEKGVLHR